jgi:hypothetical protein
MEFNRIQHIRNQQFSFLEGERGLGFGLFRFSEKRNFVTFFSFNTTNVLGK